MSRKCFGQLVKGLKLNIVQITGLILKKIGSMDYFLQSMLHKGLKSNFSNIFWSVIRLCLCRQTSP